jgi:predicted alpha/beta hydrolase family esterase
MVAGRRLVDRVMMGQASDGRDPAILLVPGLSNSGPEHWQSHWERTLHNCMRVDLRSWHEPKRNDWVNRLNMAIHRAARPVILVAHSLGCHAVAWWNEYERPGRDGPVVAAMLVAPPEVERDAADPRLTRFAPVMKTPMSFRSMVVASRDDPYAAFERSRRLARIWRSRFVDAGWLGHINAESGIDDWPYGQFLLRQLKDSVAPPLRPLVASRNYETLLAR